MDKITASLATIPGREKQCLETVKSLYPQIDYLRINMNGVKDGEVNQDLLRYIQVENFELFKTEFAVLDNRRGDGAKFYRAGQLEGYHIVCDDDIIYPPDYVKTMIAAIEQYQRKAVITIHGRTFRDGNNIRNFYSDCQIRPHCRHKLDKAHYLHCPGTGVLAYHTDTIKVKYEDFKEPNMADLWFGILAQKQKVPIICIPHGKDWIKVQDVPWTIYDKTHRRPERVTEIANSIKWELNKVQF